MVQINLLSKKKGVRKQRNLFSIIGLTIFGIFSIFFLTQVVMLVIRYISINQKLSSVAEETKTLSTEMLRENERLNQFILSKLILNQILTLRSKQFDYAGFVEQAQAVIPSGSEISGVDFQTSGFVNISVTSTSANQFNRLEEAMKTADLSASDFNSIVVKSVTRLSDGSYKTEVLFGIKSAKNGNQ